MRLVVLAACLLMPTLAAANSLFGASFPTSLDLLEHGPLSTQVLREARATARQALVSASANAVLPASPVSNIVWYNGTLCPGGIGYLDKQPTIQRSLECANVTVPFVAGGMPNGSDIPAGAFPNNEIHILVRRSRVELRNPNATTRGQIWGIPGGPGEPGTALEFIRYSKYNYDLYSADHRGTGSSAFLGCPQQQSASSQSGATVSTSEWMSCIDSLLTQYGRDGLAAFSCTMAARDLRLIMRAERASRGQGKSVSEYHIGALGESYGTLLVNRLLQVDTLEGQGATVNRAVFDGVVNPSMYNAGYQATSFQAVLNTIASSCDLDTYCSALVANQSALDTAAFMAGAVNRLRLGHCKESGFTAQLTEGVLAIMPSLAALYTWPVALLLRLDRCSSEDVTVLRGKPLQFAASVVNSFQQGLAKAPFSACLLFNIFFSSGQGGGYNPRAQLVQNVGTTTDAQQSAILRSSFQINFIGSVWPKYADPLDLHYPTQLLPDTDTLHMQGGLDGNTPFGYALEAYETYRALGAAVTPKRITKLLWHFWSGHVTTLKVVGALECAVAFMQDPVGFQSHTCLPPSNVTFENPPARDLALFGATSAQNYYGSNSHAQVPTPSPTPPIDTCASSHQVKEAADVASVTRSIIVVVLVLILLLCLVVVYLSWRTLKGGNGAMDFHAMSHSQA